MAWLFFRKYLFSKHSGSLTRVISRLCVIGIAVAVCAMVVVLSVMGGFGEHIEKRLLSYEPHLTIKSKKEKPYDQIYELKKLVSDFKSDEMDMFLMDQQEVIVRTVDSFYSGARLQGLERNSYVRLLSQIKEESQKRPSTVFTWRSLKDTSQPIEIDQLAKDEIVIGADLAHTLGAFVGDRLVMTTPESLLLPPGEIPEFRTVKIKDIIRTNLPELDNQLVIYNKELTEKMFREALSLQYFIEIYVDDVGHIETLKTQFQDMGFVAETWKDRNSTLFYSLKMEKLLIGLFLGLALFIGSFSILTVLLLLATQKRQDIGVLKTLGMNQRVIQSIFTKVGIYLSSSGILFGFILGIALCIVIDRFPLFELPDIYYDRTIPVRFEYGLYLLILGVAFFITLGSSWFPALWSSKTIPTDALRKT